MRRRAVQTVFAVMGLGLGAAGLIGCPVTSSDDCEALGSCTTTGTTTETSTGTTTTTLSPECSDFAKDDVVGDDCGVFVAPQGDPDMNGDGTKGNPFGSLAEALDKGNGKPVYVCAGTLPEAVVVSGAGTVLGGFACESWAYTGEKSRLEAPPDLAAVTVEGSATFFAQDMEIASQKPVSDGLSSIAIFVKALGNLELVRVDVTAGDGADGAAGDSPGGTAQAGGIGGPGGEGCLDAMSVVGGAGGTNKCGDVDTDGGLGGTGTASSSGGPGGPGLPAGGMGGPGAMSAGTCDPGGLGNKGAIGTSGAGAAADGSLTEKGFAGAAGDPGMAGGHGHGGGGGGGENSCANGFAGPSGAGGGAGGCGGAPGLGGGSGGASIGIAAYQAGTLTLTQVKITTGMGGTGGTGGDGQEGGDGGDGGTTPGGCKGGDGGPGGAGGAGGGGRGGHAIGIAYSGGTAPATEMVTFVKGLEGGGGPGGAYNDTPNQGAGASGVVQDLLELP